MKSSPGRTFAGTVTVGLVLSVLVGCKGKTEVRPDPQVVADLTTCRKERVDKDALITQLESQIASLKLAGGGGGFEFAIDGDILALKSSPAGGVASSIDDKTAKALSAQFIDLVAKSRGAISKCYQQALKNNTGLQAKPVKVLLRATFSAAGEFQSTSSSPSLGDTFDACLRSVAGKWKMAAAPENMTFQAPISLTPS